MARLPTSHLSKLLSGLILTNAISAPAATQDQALDAALISGNSSQLNDKYQIALRLQQHTRSNQQRRTELLSSLYQNLNQQFYPGTLSQWIRPGNPDTTFPFLIGDKGNVLASISLESGGRSLAYGTNILSELNGKNALHTPIFKRVMQWLVNGTPNSVIKNAPRVSIVGLDKSTTFNALRAAGINLSDANCNALADANCAHTAKLLILGNDANDKDLSATVRKRLQDGLPILFIHNKGWQQNPAGQEILTGLGLQKGSVDGNYWADDKIPDSRLPSHSIEMASNYSQDSELIQQMTTNIWRTDYDWSKCDESELPYNCEKVPGIVEFMRKLGELKSSTDYFNQQGFDIFSEHSAQSLKLWLLWADVTRREIHYPIDKQKDPARFQQALIADSLVNYSRSYAEAQERLGSYASKRQAEMAPSPTEETITLTLPSEEGFTAIGRLAVPGKKFEIKLNNRSKANFSVKINTQEPNSTQLWNPESYDRPFHLQSPEIKLSQQPLKLISPYGGMLQLVYSGATPGETVTLKIKGSAQHPFLDIRPDKDNSKAIADFISAIKDSPIKSAQAV